MTVESASTATVNGDNDAIALKGGDTVSVNGWSDSADVAGTGNMLTLSNGQVTLEAALRSR